MCVVILGKLLTYPEKIKQAFYLTLNIKINSTWIKEMKG